MQRKNWQYNDGDREAAGYKGQTSDCVTRAIAIAMEIPYREAYDLVNKFGAEGRRSKNGFRSSARKGVTKKTTRHIIESFGWAWTPTMQIGSGCKVHLKADELPPGRIFVNASGHVVAVIDGVIQDTHDPSREGTRCVYGYWRKAD
jgi:hypothetical protein